MTEPATCAHVSNVPAPTTGFHKPLLRGELQISLALSRFEETDGFAASPPSESLEPLWLLAAAYARTQGYDLLQGGA